MLKLTLLILSLSACADRMTVEEKLKHRSIVCVYTPTGEICEKEKPNERVPEEDSPEGAG